MDQNLEYLEAILKARIDDKKAVTTFKGIEFKDNGREFYRWESTITRGIPETCAVVIYVGVSDSPEKAFYDMCRKVMTDARLKTEVG